MNIEQYIDIAHPETEQRHYYQKMLELITPDRANQLGIPAEAPVFISPYVDRGAYCPHCGIEYTPLVYEAGQIITAQHMHEDSGGIYHYGTLKKTPPIGSTHTRWVAEILPLGEKLEAGDSHGKGMDRTTVYRSEAILITRIRAYCSLRRNSLWHEIQSGLLVPNNDKKDFLRPVCDSHISATGEHTTGNHLRFAATPDGNISFSYRFNPRIGYDEDES
jgi:hypothetical protein